MPLQVANNSRLVSQRLLAAGAELGTASSFRDVYKKLGYAPWPESSSQAKGRQLAAWLRPLAGDVLATPTDDAVKDIQLNSDAQILVLSREPSALRNLELISVYGGVTPTGMELLRRTLPEFPRLTEIHLGVDVPKGWLQSLEKIRMLWLWLDHPRLPRRLAAEHLHDITALSNLRILRIHTYALNDGDMKVLSGCTQSAVSHSAKDRSNRTWRATTIRGLAGMHRGSRIGLTDIAL